MTQRKGMTNTVKNLFVGAIMAGALIPIGLQFIATGVTCDNISAYGGCNWTGTDTIVDSNVYILYGIISVAVVIAVVLVFFNLIK